MEAVAVVARVVLAAVFVTAALGKALDPEGSREALRGFRVPERLVAPAAVALPIVESLVGVALLLAASARWGAAAAIVLLGAFAAGRAAALRRGERPECHCFGRIHSEPAGASALVRNVLLAALAVPAVLDAPVAIDAWVGDRDTAELVALVAGVVLAGLGWRAFNTRPHRTGLAVGKSVPQVELISERGTPVPLPSLVGAGKPVVLAFVSPHCGPCHELLPELARWRNALHADLGLAVISSDGEADATAQPLAQAELDVFHDPRSRASRAFGVAATPSAVLVSEDGRVASEPVAGPVGIEALVRLALG